MPEISRYGLKSVYVGLVVLKLQEIDNNLGGPKFGLNG